jgi:hypothetical protein
MSRATRRSACLAATLAVAGFAADVRADTIYNCGFKDGAPLYTINTKPAGAKCKAISGSSEAKDRGAPAGAKCRTLRFRDTVFYRCEKDGVTWVYNRPVNGPSRPAEPVAAAPGAGSGASTKGGPDRMGGRGGPDESLAAIVRIASGEAGIPEALLKAVIEVESGFRPDVISPAGAQGLMQLMPLTADSLEVEDPFNPDQNVRAGARLLRQLSDRFAGDLERTVAAYYAGASAVKRAGGPPDEATVIYVRKVVDRYRKYASLPSPTGTGSGATAP